MKNEIKKLDATPSKRLYLSIIADYDSNRSICELIDNGLDVWVRSGRAKRITIKIMLDSVQQTITVEDNAGGLPESELVYIVGPGQTGTNPTDETIGIFGVGTKRAVVALAQDIRIKTRYHKQKTYQIDFDDNWLVSEEWEIPVYEVDEIAEESTVVELQKLRTQITGEAIAQLKEHLSTTYARFLSNNNIAINVNGEALSPKFFENWSYPPGFEPRKYSGVLKTEDNREVRVEAYAGLTLESSPAAGEYGVYFYCNDRLIARALKTFDVGFTKGFAGLPHPKVSLTRVLVFLNGDARSMPWNSSKSDISTKHEVFLALHDWLVQVVKDYATLSRIWMGDWPEKVFQHTTGNIEEIQIEDFPTVKKSFLPHPPKSRPRFADIVTQKNKTVASKKPWTKGLYEGVIAAELVSKRKDLEQKNRVALIVLDSTLEIAFKEYLVNDSGYYYTDAQLQQIFAKRNLVHDEMKKFVNFNDNTWKKISYYNNLRNKLVHERATVGIGDPDIRDFKKLVERVLSKLYKLRFDYD
ncbi:MAG: ATP-binding protein [Chloroflexota bacterium]